MRNYCLKSVFKFNPGTLFQSPCLLNVGYLVAADTIYMIYLPWDLLYIKSPRVRRTPEDKLAIFFKGRDAPVNRTSGSAYSFFLGGSTSGKRVNERTSIQMEVISNYLTRKQFATFGDGRNIQFVG